jgi:uncharacterized protein
MQDRNLIDSSFLYNLYANYLPNHEEAKAFTELAGGPLIILPVVLVETTFLFRRKGSVPAVVKFLEEIYEAEFQYDDITHSDLPRIREIIAAYPKAKLDFVDACLVAYAERQNIRRICTYDYRDFNMIQPAHIDSFILLPLQFDQL